ncbi:GNAT family N-acetyltransferase [Clostridiaceae bacterium OttesenSCG-928-D20]|nr:GNAT family N-acetyltransferase [Clostridiaceae bacterium OttesenSCG-928-D20]
MKIKRVQENKKEYLQLLLLADEQESMIDLYLERGDMFVLEDGGVKAECVVTSEGEGIYEIKNIATYPEHQKKGYGRALIDYVFSYYDDCKELLVGTGDVPSALSFYKKCGFAVSHRLENFFTDNYDHEIIEDGVRLIDMIYLKRERKASLRN